MDSFSCPLCTEDFPHRHCDWHRCQKILDPHPGQGIHKYCPPPRTCREEARRAKQRKYWKRHCEEHLTDEDIRKSYQNAKKYLSNHRLTRPQSLSDPLVACFAPLLEILPTKGTARYENVWQQIREIRRRLPFDRPPILKPEILSLQAILWDQKGKDSEAARLFVYTQELQRDIGEKGRSDEAAVFVESVWTAHRAHRDWFNLAKTLIAHANIYRHLAHANIYRHHREYAAALEHLEAAIHVLKYLLHKQDRKSIKILLVEAILWKHRILIVDRKTPEAVKKQEVDLLERLAEEINGPLIWLEVKREQIRHLIIDPGDLGKATERLDEAKKIVSLSLPQFQSPYVKVQLDGAEIELLFAKFRDAPTPAKKDDAIECTQAYWDFCRNYLSTYHIDRLDGWEKEHKFKLNRKGSVSPGFSSYILPVLYLADELDTWT